MPIVLLLVIMIKKIFKVDNTWAFILFFLIAYMVFKIRTGEEYLKAFNYIIPGLRITFGSTLVSFVIALFLGLILGIGRISNNKISIEAGSTDSWKKFVGDRGKSFGIDMFGKSAPYKKRLIS